jgi:hypothetical protein
MLVRKPGGKRLLVRPRHRWKNSFKMYLEEMEWKDVD